MAAPLTLIIGNKNYSSWSLRPWLMLRQAGLAFAEIRIPLYQLETRQLLAQYSPSGKVPVLRTGDLIIWESLAIGEFIAEQVPDLLPGDVSARAVCRAVSAEMHAGFHGIRSHLPMDCRNRRANWPISASVQHEVDRMTTLWRDCRQQFGSSGDFLFGCFSLADAMFAPIVSRFVTYGVPLDPVAQAYADAIWALPAMQDWLTQAAAEPETIPDRLLLPV